MTTARRPRLVMAMLPSAKLTAARDGDWCPDGSIVLGVVVDGAFPRNIMEVHEMVNVTMGGRQLGIPYCTLCASAQAYVTDRLPADQAPAVLRAAVALQQGHARAPHAVVFDTFTGRALSGPLHDARA